MAAPRFPTAAHLREKDLEKGNHDVDEQELAVSRSESKASKVSDLSASVRSNTSATMASLEAPSNPAVSDESRKALVADHVQEEKKMNWWQAATVMLAETVSLGILSLPQAVASVGVLPGGILIVGFGFITTYTGYEVYRFKMRHPEIESFAEAGKLIAGPIGRWVVEVMQMAMLIFIMAGHITIFRSMAFKLSSDDFHVCGVIWTMIALAINILCTIPRNFKTNSWLSIFSCASIIAATFTALGSVVNRAQTTHPAYDSVVAFSATGNTFAFATAAVSNILVSYSGHIAYFNIISEMRRPKDFPKALFLTNFFTMAMYTIAGLVIYAFVGRNVEAPALDSAPDTAAKVAYALAVPTIIVAGVIAALVAAKRAYEISWRRRPEVKFENTSRAWVSWIAIVVTLWVISWLVANVIPWFSSLLAVIGAAVGTWICLGFPAIFVIHSLRADKRWKGWKVKLLWGLNVVLLVMCLVASALGMFGSVELISQENSDRKPFACAKE